MQQQAEWQEGFSFHDRANMFLSRGPRSVFVNGSTLLISSPKCDKKTLICDNGLSLPYLWLPHPKPRDAALLQRTLFRVPVKLALGDLCYTNPVERDTEHSFLVCFPPNTQAQRQGKQTNGINVYAGLLSSAARQTLPSGASNAQRTVQISRSFVLSDSRVHPHKPDLASVLLSLCHQR